MRIILLTAYLAISGAIWAQPSENSLQLNYLQDHVNYLASDELEGRATATEGEALAYRYIAGKFKAIGLEPKGDAETPYLHAFTYVAGKKTGQNNSLRVNKEPLQLNIDYLPMLYSSNGKAAGNLVNAGRGLVNEKDSVNDYKDLSDLEGKIFLIDGSFPDGLSPHSETALKFDTRARIDLAVEKGAAGILFYNSDTSAKAPTLDFRQKISPSTIPVVYLTRSGLEKIRDGKAARIQLETELLKIEATGHNVIGYLDHQAEHTIIIGAHYDHLGYGDEHNSLHRGETREIHNGADDNASGTALIIELARYFKMKQQPQNNYLFIAFSGEELGLFGSNAFVDQPTIDLKTVNYMINYDMVGRLDTAKKTIAINGIGTSPEFIDFWESYQYGKLTFKTSESGVGPSDHTSFYLKDIPVLHFFTGTHGDYHKPSDDVDKVNFEGINTVGNITIALIDSLNKKGKIPFTKTKDQDNNNAPRFTVTLGVVPDYLFSGEGMRIDGVSEGKPAKKAGMKAGDVVIQMGEQKVVDMMSYMKGLSLFEKGDETIVKVMRDKKVKEFKVVF